jgi:hypothetical protein
LPSRLNTSVVIRGLVLTGAGLLLSAAHAQQHIYRCGNEYINNAEVAKRRGCTLLEGGNITTVWGIAPQRPESGASKPAKPSSKPAEAPRSSGERIDASAQRARDSDARTILEAEMRRAQERLGEAQQAYAQGQPEKQGGESRNHQRYLDRVAELKAAVARAQVDVESLRRELARLGSSATASAAPAARATARP